MEYYVGASRMIFRETVILDFFLLGCLLGITEYTTFSLAMYELLKGNRLSLPMNHSSAVIHLQYV